MYSACIGKGHHENTGLLDTLVYTLLTTYTDFHKIPMKETDGKSGWWVKILQ